SPPPAKRTPGSETPASSGGRSTHTSPPDEEEVAEMMDPTPASLDLDVDMMAEDSAGEDSGEESGDDPETLMRRGVNKVGKLPEAGIIKTVYVENFMCHVKMKVDLCSNVNFINGQNGSGKSAVLAAIQICLGAGARRTHRASNLSKLIRNGSNATHARLRVKLLNKGNDAFRHDVYGDFITVERTLDKGGGSSYKLLDQNDKCKSTKKADLDALLDLFNIQVDNPVAVLDQEEAKKFLMGKDEDKYNFFCKATELERIDRSFAATTDSIKDLEDSQRGVMRSLAPAQELAERTKEEWDQCQALENLEKKVEEAKVSLAWCLCGKMKAEAEKEQAKHDEYAEKVEAARKKLADLESKRDGGDGSEQQKEKTAAVEKLSNEAKEAAAIKNKLADELKQAKKPLATLESKKKQLAKELKSNESGLAKAKKELEKEKAAILARIGEKGSKGLRMKELDEKETEIEELVESATSAGAERDAALEEFEQAKDDYLSADKQCKFGGSKVKEATTTLQSLQKSTDTINVWGQQASKFCQLIAAAKQQGKFRGEVVGPVGAYIKVKTGFEKWGKLAEAAINSMHLGAYLCSDQRDLKALRELRRQTRCKDSEHQVNFQRAGARYTVDKHLRALDRMAGVENCLNVLNIQNDLVFNFLCDSSRADRKALSETKTVGEDALIQRQNGRMVVVGGDLQECYFYPRGDYWSLKNGNMSMRSSDSRGQLPQRFGIDQKRAVQEGKLELKQLQDELEELEKERNSIGRRQAELKNAWNALNKKVKDNEYAKKVLEEEVERLQQEIDEADEDDVEDDTSHLVSAIATAQNEVDESKRELQELEAKFALEAPAVGELEGRLQEENSRNQKIIAECQEAEEALKRFLSDQGKIEEKIERNKRNLEAASVKLEEFKAVFEESKGRADASDRKARVFTHKTKVQHMKNKARGTAAAGDDDDDDEEPPASQDDDEIAEPTEEEIAAVEPVSATKDPSFYSTKAEKAAERVKKEMARRSMSEVDPVAVFDKYTRAKKNLADKMHAVKKTEENLAALKADVKERRRKWKSMRKHIARLTNSTFDEMLQKKGSAGVVEFDHADKTLKICVQKDSNEASQTSDVKALSGGERSYTTLSLLLALGEQLETPFRVMDEFDVFLDAVARKIALEQLVSTAQALSHRQFIFITPQDLSTLTPTNTLKIIKMRPPERGGAQTVIEF
ncbi:hypothetical protein TeGR_g348, partial [Tetraparma gracilis]